MANKETRKTISPILGNKLNEIRKDKDLSQSKLAESVGAHPSIIGLYERAKRLPSTEMVRKLANALNYDENELLSLREDTIMETVMLLGDEAPKAMQNERNMIAHALDAHFVKKPSTPNSKSEDYEVKGLKKITVHFTIGVHGEIFVDGKEIKPDELGAYLQKISDSHN